MLCMLGLQAGFIVSLKSSAATFFTGNPLAGRLHYGASPLETTSLVAAAVLFCLWQHRTIVWGPFQKKIVLTAGACWLLLALCSLLLAHPPAPWNTLFDGMNGEALRPSVFAAIRYSVIMSMLIPTAFLCFPPAFLHTYRMLFWIAGGSVFAYLWLSILRIALHAPMASGVLTASYTVLSWFTSEASMSATNLTLANGSFSVIVGPECLGLDSVALFLSIWPLFWYLASRNHTVSTLDGIIGLTGGVALLLALNIIRIVLIMMVGALLPATGIDLFHGGAGAVLFLGTLLAFLPLLRQRRQ